MPNKKRKKTSVIHLGAKKGARSRKRRRIAAEKVNNTHGFAESTENVILENELGATGTPNFSGFITEDFNPDFTGTNSVRIFDEMRRTDGTVSGVLKAVKLPILATEQIIESADPEDERQNEIAEGIRQDLLESLDGGFHAFLREALGMLDFGYYYFEKVWEVREGSIRLKKLAARLPSAHLRWNMQSTGEDGVTQILPNVDPTKTDISNQPEIPASKILLFTNEREGDNFEGVSLLRPAYKHFFLKDTLYRIDGVQHERGAGIPIITMPKSNTAQDKLDAEELGENLKTNEQSFILFPNGDWTAEMMTGGFKEKSNQLIASIQHHDRMITMTVLAAFLDLGSGSTGSRSLSEDQTNFFTLALEAITKNVEQTINAHLIKQMTILRFGEQEKYPTLKFLKIGDFNAKEMAETVKALIDSRLVKVDPRLKVWAHKNFKLPDLTLEEAETQMEEEDEDEEDPDDDNEPEGNEGGAKKPNPKEEKKKGKLSERHFAHKKRRFFRELTLAEKRVEFDDIGDFFDDTEAALQASLEELTEKQKKKLLADAEKILDKKNIGAVENLELPREATVNAAVTEIAKDSLDKGKVAAAAELGLKTIPVTTAFTKKALASQIALFLKQRGDLLTDPVKRRLINLMKNDIGTASALFELEKLIDKNSRRANAKLGGTVVVDSFNEGRNLSFDKMTDQLHGMQRSEILDRATCNMCMSIDGRVVKPTDPFAQVSQIHDNCRGIWVGILKTDAELPVAKQIPKSLRNKFDTVEGVPQQNDFEQPKKPIVTKDSRAALKIKEGELKPDIS